MKSREFAASCKVEIVQLFVCVSELGGGGIFVSSVPFLIRQPDTPKHRDVRAILTCILTNILDSMT